MDGQRGTPGPVLTTILTALEIDQREGAYADRDDNPVEGHGCAHPGDPTLPANRALSEETDWPPAASLAPPKQRLRAGIEVVPTTGEMGSGSAYGI